MSALTRLPNEGPSQRTMARKRLRPGDTFESYEIVGLLGEGGRGSVFEAVETFSRRPVALKVLKVEIEAGPDSDAVQRARAEAMALARIQHPNVVQMLAAGVSAQGAPWLATELVRGMSLRAYAARHKPSLPRAMRIVLELCEGVAAAHEHGTIHRDIKPENVLVTEQGQVKVIDFNIAKLYDANTFVKSTMPGQQPGTPAYMTPEQIHGEPIGPFTDVYLVGLIAYELFGHRYVFLQADGSFPEGVLALGAHLFQTPRPLVDLGVPEGIAAIVMRALSKVPAQRQQTMVELASGLRSAFQAWLAMHPEEDTYGRPSMQSPGARREHVPPTALVEQPTAPELPDSSVVVRVAERVPQPAMLAAGPGAPRAAPRAAWALAKTEAVTSPIPAPVGQVPTLELADVDLPRRTVMMPAPSSAPSIPTTPHGTAPSQRTMDIPVSAPTPRSTPQNAARTAWPMLPAAAAQTGAPAPVPTVSPTVSPTPPASPRRAARPTWVRAPASRRGVVLTLALSVPALLGGVVAALLWLKAQGSEPFAAPPVEPTAAPAASDVALPPSADPPVPSAPDELTNASPEASASAPPSSVAPSAHSPSPRAPTSPTATGASASPATPAATPAATPPAGKPAAPASTSPATPAPKPPSAKDLDPSEDRSVRF